jgi:hypothetical protein
MRRERRVIHVSADEFYDVAMCGADIGNGELKLGVVAMREWFTDPSQIQRATCPECLLKLFMLGDSAQIALARMGMKVDVRNEEEIA